jgi:hypothetical protein
VENKFNLYQWGSARKTQFLHYRLGKKYEINGGKKTFGQLISPSVYTLVDHKVAGWKKAGEEIEVPPFCSVILTLEDRSSYSDFPPKWPENLRLATWQELLFFIEQIPEEPENDVINTPDVFFTKWFRIPRVPTIVEFYSPSVRRAPHGRVFEILSRTAGGGGGCTFGPHLLMVK